MFVIPRSDLEVGGFRMHGLRRAWVAGLLGGAGLVGCSHTKTYDTDVPITEEWRTAPTGEERFDHPPERGYTKPPPKKEFKPSVGGGGGGMGGPGMGAMGGGGQPY